MIKKKKAPAFNPIPSYCELLSVLVLAFAVNLSLQTRGLPVATPVIAALTVGIFVYAIGPVSGAHINPAVTIGLWSIGKISGRDALAYIVAQVLGGVVAMVLAFAMLERTPHVDVFNTLGVVVAELIGAFILLFGITGVVYGKVTQSASGLVIGGSLLLGILLAVAAGSNGVLNPAVAVGVGSASAAYVIGPVIGGVLGAWTGRYLLSEK